jgi:hypothetical protein
MTSNEVEDRINNPARYGITKIRVLRVGAKLPVNKQVGATCGMYALQAALLIQGCTVAPPPRKQVLGYNWRDFDPPILKNVSIRGRAKEMGLTQIGEIGGAAEMVALAGGLGVGAKAKTERFASLDELWKLIVDAVNAGKGIVMPYACAGDDGEQAWSNGVAHWCLFFGYAEN